MAFKKRTFSKNKKTYKRKSYAKKARKVTPLKRMIRREISRNIENKGQQAFNFNRSIYSSSNANFPDNVIELGPSNSLQIAQGTGRSNRIGNKIKTKKLVWKGDICMNPYDATTNTNPIPQMVKLVIFYDRVDPTALPAISTNFFQNGNSNTGFNNDLVDMWRPFNTERYRILATKTFKVGFATNMGTGTVPGFQGYTSNDYKMTNTFSFDLTKFYPKIVTFDENNVIPNSRGLFAAFYCAAGSGQTNSGNWIPCSMQWMQDYVFEDA